MRAEDLNLLKSKNSCIRSSTAIGYILEEFIFQKLKNVLTFSADKKIYRESGGTQNRSYDFIISDSKKDLLINVKTENINSSNNAIASIKKLYSDYNIHFNNKKDFYYITLKIIYRIDNKKDSIKTEIDYYNDIQILGIEFMHLKKFLLIMVINKIIEIGQKNLKVNLVDCKLVQNFIMRINWNRTILCQIKEH